MVGPFETNPPLIVNPDAVLTLAVAKQGLKTIAGQCAQVSQRCGCLEAIEFQACERAKPENALTHFPAAKSPVLLSR